MQVNQKRSKAEWKEGKETVVVLYWYHKAKKSRCATQNSHTQFYPTLRRTTNACKHVSKQTATGSKSAVRRQTVPKTNEIFSRKTTSLPNDANWD